MGAFLFRHRSWLPVPFVLVPLFSPSYSTRIGWIIGAALILLGEAMRLSGVAAAGTVTRRRSRDVQRLVTYGLFSWSRNPLYNGNFLVWMGFVFISWALWFLPIAILIFAIEYGLIVRYEEAVLESIFGDEYLEYKAGTPRWIPQPPRIRSTGEYHWGESWRSEVSTFLQYAALIVAFVVKNAIIKPGS